MGSDAGDHGEEVVPPRGCRHDHDAWLVGVVAGVFFPGLRPSEAQTCIQQQLGTTDLATVIGVRHADGSTEGELDLCGRGVLGQTQDGAGPSRGHRLGHRR